MKTTTDILKDIDESLNDLAEKALKAEMQNAQLKETVRILGRKIGGGEMTQREADYVKRVVTDANVYTYENKVDNVIDSQ